MAVFFCTENQFGPSIILILDQPLMLVYYMINHPLGATPFVRQRWSPKISRPSTFTQRSSKNGHVWSLAFALVQKQDFLSHTELQPWEISSSQRNCCVLLPLLKRWNNEIHHCCISLGHECLFFSFSHFTSDLMKQHELLHTINVKDHIVSLSILFQRFLR